VARDLAAQLALDDIIQPPRGAHLILHSLVEGERVDDLPARDRIGHQLLLVQRQVVTRGGVTTYDPAFHTVHFLHERHLEMQSGLDSAPAVLPELGDDSLLGLVDYEEGAEA
jgi:hypothetical protein